MGRAYHPGSFAQVFTQMAIKSIFSVVNALKSELDNLSIADLKREIAERTDLLLVDIREIQETIDLGTIPGAVHVPRGMLEFWADPASPYARDMFNENKRIVVFCAGGGRSAFAAKALLDMGFPKVGHLDVGFNGWAKAGEAVQEVASSSRWMRKIDPKAAPDVKQAKAALAKTLAKDERPPVWLGHASLAVMDIPRSVTFFQKLGMRLVEAHERMAILELRGGTHLLVLQADNPTKRRAIAPFDLMVDNIDATHAELVIAGIKPSAIEADENHRFFTVTEPSGYTISINSSHVTGLPV